MSGDSFPSPPELLPHAGRAILIDEILAHATDTIDVVAHITDQHPYFVAGKGVPTWVGIELMAQAAAIHAGMSGRELGRGPQAGVLLGTRRYISTTGWFPEGAELIIHARREFSSHGGFGACDCEIHMNGELCTEATIIVAEISSEEFDRMLHQ